MVFLLLAFTEMHVVRLLDRMIRVAFLLLALIGAIIVTPAIEIPVSHLTNQNRMRLTFHVPYVIRVFMPRGGSLIMRIQIDGVVDLDSNDVVFIIPTE